MKRITILSLTALLGAVLTASSENVVIKGSDTLGAKLVPQLAEQFKSDHPGSSFDIAAEGSATGFAALIDKTAALGMASRPAKADEIAQGKAKGVELEETTVAYDGIAVIVNEGNPVKALTRKQVEQIFTGEISDWSAVGGKGGKISLYTRNTSSGTYAEFREMAMKKRDYAPSSQKLAGNEQIAQEVGNNANGIGYVGLAYSKAKGIKVLPIDGALPSKESILAKSYPYARPTFYYTDGDATGVVKEFIDFTVSEAGQKIVEQVGFVPIK